MFLSKGYNKLFQDQYHNFILKKYKSILFIKSKPQKVELIQIVKHILNELRNTGTGTSLVVQWLRLHASSAVGQGSVPAQGTRSHRLQLKDSECHKEEQRSQVLLLRSELAKCIHYYTFFF